MITDTILYVWLSATTIFAFIGQGAIGSVIGYLIYKKWFKSPSIDELHVTLLEKLLATSEERGREWEQAYQKLAMLLLESNTRQ